MDKVTYIGDPLPVVFPMRLPFIIFPASSVHGDAPSLPGASPLYIELERGQAARTRANSPLDPRGSGMGVDDLSRVDYFNNGPEGTHLFLLIAIKKSKEHLLALDSAVGDLIAA